MRSGLLRSFQSLRLRCTLLRLRSDNSVYLIHLLQSSIPSKGGQAYFALFLSLVV